MQSTAAASGAIADLRWEAQREDSNLLDPVKHLLTLPRRFMLTPAVHGLGLYWGYIEMLVAAMVISRHELLVAGSLHELWGHAVVRASHHQQHGVVFACIRGPDPALTFPSLPPWAPLSTGTRCMTSLLCLKPCVTGWLLAVGQTPYCYFLSTLGRP